MIGLIEWLDARGGQDDVFRIAAESGREFGQVLQAVKLLELVDTPKRLAVLTADGKAFAAATPEALEHRLPRDFVLETIVLRMPSEDYDRVFQV